ncbi:MAG: ABC transporter permease [bacterium]
MRKKLYLSILISPSVFWLVVFFLIPLAIVLVYSFKQNIYRPEKLIFSIEYNDSMNFLDKSIIPKELAQGFERYGIALSDQAYVLIDKPNKKWRIGDRNNYYFVIKKDHEARIYPSVYGKKLRKLLFSIDLSFQKYLDESVISESLLEEFRNNDAYLTDYSKINIKVYGEKWEIEDFENKRTYLIEKEGPRLSIYLKSITLGNYLSALNPVYLEAIVRSFWMAMANTLICLVIGYPVAYYISHRSIRVKNILLILTILPFWTNFLVRTYAWMVILRGEGLINTILIKLGLINEPLQLLFTSGAVLTGLVYGYLPFMILPLYASIEKVNPSLLEAAYDLGANRIQTFLRVMLPLTYPGIIAGSILVFVPSLGAFVTPDLLGGAKVIMIGNLIQNQFLKVRNYPFGSALSFILMGVVLILLFFYVKLGEKEDTQ